MEEYKETKTPLILAIICCIFGLVIILLLAAPEKQDIKQVINHEECNCVYNIQYINQDKQTSKYIEIEAPCDRWDNNDTLILIKK